MNRRGFLSAVLAAGAAPAIVRAESLMKIIVPSNKIIIRQTEFGEAFFPTIVYTPDIHEVENLVKAINNAALKSWESSQLKAVSGSIILPNRILINHV